MIGDNLRYFRKKKEVSITQMADDLGYTAQALSQYELNKRKPSVQVLRNIAEYLEIPISYILNGNDFIQGLLDLVDIKSYEAKDFDSLMRSRGINPDKLSPWFSSELSDLENLDQVSIEAYLKFLFEEGQNLSAYYRNAADAGLYIPEHIESKLRWLELRYDFDLSDLPTWEQAREYLEKLNFNLIFDSKTGKVDVLQDKDLVAVAFKASIIQAYVQIQKEVDKYAQYYALKTFEEIDERQQK